MSRQSNPGIVGDGLIKPENLVLLGAESYLGRVVRVTYPRYFRSSYQFSFTSFLPLFLRELWVGRGLNCPRLRLWAIFGLIFFELWAITFFGLGLWTLHEQVGLAHKLSGPTTTKTR